MNATALELLAIRKQLGSVLALRGADFVLRPGEFHALLGENGAGKSTLMHVAFGLLQPDAGRILVAGVIHEISSPRAAQRQGIGMVHQHFTSIPALTVAENIALAVGWRVSRRSLLPQVRLLMERIGLSLEPDARAETLSVGEKQRLEILKALAGEARILLLDEPTAVLSPAEADELLQVVRRFTRGGGAAVLITHKLDEALGVTDRVTVLRRGETVFSGATSGLNRDFLASQLVGPGYTDKDGQSLSTMRSGQTLVQCTGLQIARERGPGLAVRNVSLTLRAGDVIGFAGIEGNGQRELLRCIAGLIPPTGGRLEVAGPVGFVPEDRTTEGLIPSFTLTQNLALALGADADWVRGVWINWRKAEDRMGVIIATFGIRAAGPQALARSLSGGNQQKAVVAMAFERRPEVLVAEQPTRGLDIRAATEIHQRLRDFARSGGGVLAYSSDLDEVVELGNRKFAMTDGIAREAPGASGRAELGALMLGRNE